jgi:hypothetical protein
MLVQKPLEGKESEAVIREIRPVIRWLVIRYGKLRSERREMR